MFVIMVIIIVNKIHDFALIKKLMALLLFSSLFFTTEVLASGILLLYVKNTLGTHFYSITLPLPYYTMILSLVAILSTLVFSKYLMSLENKITNFHYYKLTIGGLVGAVSMFLVVFSHQTNSNLGLSLVFLSLILIGFADFIIIPSILSYLALFSSEKIKSALYSLWFMSIALSAYISIKLFTLATLVSNPQQNSPDRYLMTFLFTGILLLLVLPFLALLKLKKVSEPF